MLTFMAAAAAAAKSLQSCATRVSYFFFFVSYMILYIFQCLEFHIVDHSLESISPDNFFSLRFQINVILYEDFPEPP